MAMRFGHRICSHVRINNLPAFSTSLRGRSYCSGSISPVPGVAGVKASTLLGVSSFAIWAGWFYRYDVLSLRTMVENLKAEKKAREMTKRLNRVKLLVEEENYQKLDRNKFKSEDDCLKMIRSAELNSEYAYLEMLERELGLLDAKIYQRRSIRLYVNGNRFSPSFSPLSGARPFMGARSLSSSSMPSSPNQAPKRVKTLSDIIAPTFAVGVIYSCFEWMDCFDWKYCFNLVLLSHFWMLMLSFIPLHIIFQDIFHVLMD